MNILEHFGRYMVMLKDLFTRPDNKYMYGKEIFRQMNNIGVGSLLIVGIISLFVGAVTAIQFAYQLDTSFLPPYILGFIIRDSVIIELAPTLSGLLLAGKVGSNLSSELGTMRISEQIDALEIMGVNSRNYLLGPKIWAAVLIVPPLIIIAAFLGVSGGYLAAVNTGISPAMYEKGLMYMFKSYNVFIMMVKSTVFAFLVASIACYQGYFVKGGAIEIGKASTRAVVLGSIFIILFDYFITLLLT
ncbi:MAG: ABC transporter permease [Chitinophagales bacterium]|jgi:phospholipid/cholesterol/gamma-HCH transport system permease protein|nr:ABC transporter permease [Chitinophagales bacterium]HNL07007.1 ABC transporter permease [Chitinophagales bacterium]